MRMAIFGGSFDPVHLGHLWIAESAVESLRLDQVRWVPAAMSPLKPDGPIASAEDRIEMLRLAISGNERHIVDDREIRRGSISYTVDTVAELQHQFSDAEIFLLIGSDSLATIGQWHESKRLLQKIDLAVVQRGGEPDIDFRVLRNLVDQDRIQACQRNVVKMPIIEISSRDLRTRIATRRSIRFRTPRSVEAFIEAKKLYRAELNEQLP